MARPVGKKNKKVTNDSTTESTKVDAPATQEAQHAAGQISGEGIHTDKKEKFGRE